MKTNLNVFVTNHKKDCNKCSGYGVFGPPPDHILTHCPFCKSIHPEAFGLTFMKEFQGYGGIYLYLKESERSWLFFGF